MARPRIIPINESLQSLFPTRLLKGWARTYGAVRRERKVNITTLFWSLVLGFGVGRARTLSGLRREYEQCSGHSLEESSFYDRFNAGLARMMRQAAIEALEKMAGCLGGLKGVLAPFRDLLITDSTVMKLHDMLESKFPGCRTNHSRAAMKLHMVMSVAGTGGNSIRLTDGRRHDCRMLHIGEWVRGSLLLFDLGYFSYRIFSRIDGFGGYFVSRLKDNANPQITKLLRICRGRSIDLVGRNLKEVQELLRRETVDAEVGVSFRRRRYLGRTSPGQMTLRLVGVRDEQRDEYHFYLTNVPNDRLTAEEVAGVYAARWQIELVFKELKSHYRMADLPSRNRHVVEALVYAAIITLVVSRRILTLAKAKLREKAERMHDQRWAILFAEVSRRILLIMTRPKNETRWALRSLCMFLFAEAPDPNCDRPSLLKAVEFGTHRYCMASA